MRETFLPNILALGPLQQQPLAQAKVGSKISAHEIAIPGSE